MVNIPLGKNAPFRKIYFGAIIPINNAVTQSDKKVYIRVCLFSCHCCKLLFANKKSNAPSTKPLASEGMERFSTKPATPLPATIIAHGYVTQKSYITFHFPSSRLLLSSSSLTENTKSLVLAFGVLPAPPRGLRWSFFTRTLSSTRRNEDETEDDDECQRLFLSSSVFRK